jgi:hypothetical protein
MAVVSDETDSCNLLGFHAGDWSGLRCAALSHCVGYRQVGGTWCHHPQGLNDRVVSQAKHCITALKLWSVTHVSCVQYSNAQAALPVNVV